MTRKKPTVIFVVIIHMAVISLAWFLPGLLNRMRPVTVPPDAMFVSLVVPEAAVVDAPQVDVSQPAPPPKTDLPPTPMPKKKKKKIQISKKRIVRDQVPTPQKKLTPEEVRKQLALQSASSSASDTKLPLPAWYYASVREVLYGAWKQPANLRAEQGHQVQVQLTVARDGRITAKRVLLRSGQPDMDESVNAALSAVGRLKALPVQYSGSSVEITIIFELNRG